MSVAILVDRAVRAAGIPIDGVSIGDPANRATWACAFTAAATPAHKATAATILTTVAVDVPAQALADEADAQAFIDTIPIWAKALALAIIDQLNVIRGDLTTLGINRPAITVPQALAAIRAKAGQL